MGAPLSACMCKHLTVERRIIDYNAADGEIVMTWLKTLICWELTVLGQEGGLCIICPHLSHTQLFNIHSISFFNWLFCDIAALLVNVLRLRETERTWNIIIHLKGTEQLGKKSLIAAQLPMTCSKNTLSDKAYTRTQVDSPNSIDHQLSSWFYLPLFL